MPRSFLRGFFFARSKRRTLSIAGLMGRTSMRSQDNFDQRLNRTADGVMAATTAPPIATYGEVFADGAIIELIQSAHGGSPALMLWGPGRESLSVAYPVRRYSER
jgi:hypothetical protein